MSKLLFKDYFGLAVAIFMSTLLLFPDVPIWCFSLSILFWLWRLFCHVLDFPIPSRKITGFLSFLALAVILMDFRTLMGKEPAASFIIILSGLKALEFSDDTEKDFLVLLGFFLMSSKFLFSYDLMYLILSLPIYAVLTMNLFPSAWLKSNLRDAFKYLVKVILLAVPMATAMFILLPRITKTLLEIPTNSRYGSTGFSDTVSPGSISKLSQSNEVVMRLELFNKRINLSDLYFSGLTLEQVSQMTWSYLRNTDGVTQSDAPSEVDYRLILEPHYRTHVFSLKNTDKMSSEGLTIYYDVNYNFRMDSFLEKKAFIQASIASARGKATEAVLKRNLKKPILPPLADEQKKQMQTVLRKIKGSDHSAENTSKAILDFFASNRFTYTLNPGDQPQLSLYDFLFKYRKGYCEHYASAMALLFRLSGVPARVIVGYHGGELNPVGNFWTIRQKDAHAWVEYVNSQNKWVMVDPVTVVAPQRIELGFNIYNSIVTDMLTEEEIKNKLSGTDTFSKLSMWFDNVNYQWSTFLLEYDFDKQKDILKSLNLSLGNALIIILVILFLISVLINLVQKRGVRKNISEKCFEEINTWASRFELQKKATEGPIDWQTRIAANLPEKSRAFLPQLEKAFGLWITLSYRQSLSIPDSKRSLSEIRKIMKKG
jgi:transglutaminase-like putative cysteine protease